MHRPSFHQNAKSVVAVTSFEKRHIFLYLADTPAAVTAVFPLYTSHTRSAR